MAEKTEEQWQHIARDQLEFFRARRDLSTEAHIGYGKWLIASMLLIHGGALVAISQLGERAGPVFASAGLWFLVGLLLAIAAGFFAWVNFQIAEREYANLANPGMQFDFDDWKEVSESGGRWINRTLYAAVVCGVISWAVVAVGAYFAFKVFSP